MRQIQSIAKMMLQEIDHELCLMCKDYFNYSSLRLNTVNHIYSWFLIDKIRIYSNL